MVRVTIDGVNGLTCQTIAYQFNRGFGYHEQFMNTPQSIIRDLMLAGF